MQKGVTHISRVKDNVFEPLPTKVEGILPLTLLEGEFVRRGRIVL